MNKSTLSLLTLSVITIPTAHTTHCISVENIVITGSACALGYATYCALTQKSNQELINDAQLYAQQADRSYHKIQAHYEHEMAIAHAPTAYTEQLQLLEECIAVHHHGINRYLIYLDDLERDLFEIERHIPCLEQIQQELLDHKVTLLTHHQKPTTYYSKDDYHLYEFDRLLNYIGRLLHELETLTTRLEHLRSCAENLPAYQQEQAELDQPVLYAPEYDEALPAAE